MRASRSFTIIALVLLVWNLIGVLAFIMQYTADLAALAKTDPYTAHIFAQMPSWAWTAYAVAVGAGALGAIFLILRKAAAISFFLLSAVAIIAQFGYSFLGTDLLAAKGPASAVFPAIIPAIAVGQLIYVRSLRRKGVLR